MKTNEKKKRNKRKHNENVFQKLAKRCLPGGSPEVPRRLPGGSPEVPRRFWSRFDGKCKTCKTNQKITKTKEKTDYVTKT